jgi:dolichyl-phosphate-mannose-protein mannosyltransferase
MRGQGSEVEAGSGYGYDRPMLSRLNRYPWSGPESAIVFAITIVAAALRFNQFGRLGIDHFDEGIYASVAAWSLRPEGLSAIDPGLIPYAPPGYPTLVGLAYVLIGPSDLSAITVSILAGVASIPIVAWIGRRTFGPSFGIAAAGFAAGSGLHITFSRMALTDATFLLIWLVAIGLGGRFLERPGLVRAVGLGLAVGLAQLAKYNGWLLGVIVAATAAIGPLVSTVERRQASVLRTLGWGLLAAIVAATVYSPWFRFVDDHGGYSSLLKHQRSYLGEVGAWPSHWLMQMRQLVALSGGIPGAALGVLIAISGLICVVLLAKAPRKSPWLRAASITLLVVALGRGQAGWWLGLGLSGFFLVDESPSIRLVAVWWLVLTLLTPLYHPYARLWLPLEGAGWLMSASVVGIVLGWWNWPGGWPDRDYFQENRSRLVVVTASLLASFLLPTIIPPRPKPLPDSTTSPRDSFRKATAAILAKIPPGVRVVVFLARPTLPFYASGPLAARGVATSRLGSIDDLLRSTEGWAIVDSVLLRQEPDPERSRARLLDRWTLVAEEATTLSNATLLDVDPAAAVGDLSARDESLLLLRQKRERSNP